MRPRLRVRKAPRAAFLLALVCAPAFRGCVSSEPSAAPAPSATEDPEILSQARELATFLKEKLLLDAAQEEKTKESAVRLFERNTKILAPEGAKPRARLEALRQSGAAFDRDMMAILTAEQLLRYADLKLQFQGSLTGQRSGRPRRGVL